ncbi:MAG: hypothetical protein ABI758_01325 [Candidatus Woesebacteria bacterium]
MLGAREFDDSSFHRDDSIAFPISTLLRILNKQDMHEEDFRIQLKEVGFTPAEWGLMATAIVRSLKQTSKEYEGAKLMTMKENPVNPQMVSVTVELAKPTEPPIFFS